MFTDQFFVFPIKVYDGFSARMAERQEEDLNTPVEADWHKGWVRMPYQEFEQGKVYWFDSFSNGRNVAEEGFDGTHLYSERFGNFTSTWDRKKFEEKLNEFFSKREQKVKENI
jgi:hypothetical protein